MVSTPLSLRASTNTWKPSVSSGSADSVLMTSLLSDFPRPPKTQLLCSDTRRLSSISRRILDGQAASGHRAGEVGVRTQKGCVEDEDPRHSFESAYRRSAHRDGKSAPGGTRAGRHPRPHPDHLPGPGAAGR